MGFIIYDKLMIEYEKYIKEVIMWIDNSEIKDQGTNIAQWDIAGQEIERIKKLSSPNEMFKELYMGTSGNDLAQSEINEANLKPLIDVGTKQLDRMAELQRITFESKDFLKKYEALADTDRYKKELNLGLGDLDELAPAFGNAIRKQLSDEDFAKDLQKRYPRITKEDIRDVTEAYKDVSSIFNQEMDSKYNDISLKNYDAIMKAYNDHKEYFGKDSKTFKSLVNPKEVFDRLKGSNGKERLFISSLLATMPTEDLVGMLKDQGTEGFNAIMNLLDSRPENRNSFNSAIT
ncbi:MAG: hypothetical protein IKL08_01435, partial [Clostridia bacterium]|nr:hypothetical protein [Clostridia bacterium]